MESMLSPRDIQNIAKMVADELFERLAGSPRLVDGLDAAESCGISLATLERGKAAGEIPFVQFGTRVKYDVEAVIAARTKNVQRPTADDRSPAPPTESTEHPPQLSALERARLRAGLHKHP